MPTRRTEGVPTDVPRWETAFIALGGNVGDVRSAMSAALCRLHRHREVRVDSISALYRTPPWGDTDQADFLNASAQVSVRLEPLQLLRLAKKLEREQKREKTRRWGPRTLDIDLLVWPGRELETAKLTLPHPRIAERAFVLLPLADIAPDLELGRGNVSALAAAADRSGIERIAEQGEWWRPGDCV